MDLKKYVLTVTLLLSSAFVITGCVTKGAVQELAKMSDNINNMGNTGNNTNASISLTSSSFLELTDPSVAASGSHKPKQQVVFENTLPTYAHIPVEATDITLYVAENDLHNIPDNLEWVLLSDAHGKNHKAQGPFTRAGGKIEAADINTDNREDTHFVFCAVEDAAAVADCGSSTSGSIAQVKFTVTVDEVSINLTNSSTIDDEDINNATISLTELLRAKISISRGDIHNAPAKARYAIISRADEDRNRQAKEITLDTDIPVDKNDFYIVGQNLATTFTLCVVNPDIASIAVCRAGSTVGKGIYATAQFTVIVQTVQP